MEYSARAFALSECRESQKHSGTDALKKYFAPRRHLFKNETKNTPLGEIFRKGETEKVNHWSVPVTCTDRLWRDSLNSLSSATECVFAILYCKKKKGSFHNGLYLVV